MKRIALGFGVAMVAAGIAGFIPWLCPRQLLFGLFAVNDTHNLVHIATGLVAISVADSDDGIRIFFRVFGGLYATLAVLGFETDNDVLGIANNAADVGLHIAIAAMALYLGFFDKQSVMIRATWHNATDSGQGPSGP